MSNLLFSIAIISFNNYEYIFETIDSVLNQDYHNIELLISDDASKIFDEQVVEKYVADNKRDNIVSFSVWKQPQNLGTVANAEFCRTHATGQAFYLVAADDVLEDSQVISRFAKAMDTAPEDVEIFSGHAKMYDQLLKTPRYNWTTTAEVNLIRQGDSKKIFSRLSNRTLIPTTGTCYRMKLLDRVGGYDRSYKLIEDAPLYLKAARLGAKFCWIDDFVAARHRAGGMCHSKTDYRSSSFRKYTKDRMRIFKKEVFPYIARLDPIDLDPMLKLWYASRYKYKKSHGIGFVGEWIIHFCNFTFFVITYSIVFSHDMESTFKDKLIALARIMKRHLKNYYKKSE